MGQALPVVYNPADPSGGTIDTLYQRWYPAWMPILAGGLLLIVSRLLAAGLDSRLRRGAPLLAFGLQFLAFGAFGGFFTLMGVAACYSKDGEEDPRSRSSESTRRWSFRIRVEP